MQGAEYQNPRESMATGCTKEEISTDDTRCQGKSGRREKKVQNAE